MKEDLIFSLFGIALERADILLLIVCPIFGTLGSLVGVARQHTLFVNSSFGTYAKLSSVDLANIKSVIEQLKNASEQLYLDDNRETINRAIRVMSDSRKAIISYQKTIDGINEHIELWNQRLKPRALLRIILGFGLGLAIALYFIGAIQTDVTSIARLCLACFLLGYQAPKVWLLQENIIASMLEQRLRAILENLEISSKE